MGPKSGDTWVDGVRYGTCRYCHRLFVRTSDSHVYCCAQCRLNDTPDHKEYVKKLEKNRNDIKLIDKMAKEEGLTYGQYVAKHRLYTERKGTK